MMKKFISINLIVFSMLTTSQAAEFAINIDIPKINVSEYHAPYIATWIENDQGKAVIATSLWYDEQEKWLKDIRQWWRRTGRSQSPPYDGVTAATRRPGMHKLVLQAKKIEQQLLPGNYKLMIEASREVGGREVLSLPFSWPVKNTLTVSAQGEHELGTVTLTILNP